MEYVGVATVVVRAVETGAVVPVEVKADTIHQWDLVVVGVVQRPTVTAEENTEEAVEVDSEVEDWADTEVGLATLEKYRQCTTPK